jgi:hypothetical protein
MFGNNSNVFGQLNQNLNKPAFNFGSTQPTQQQQQSSTFVFGATSQNEVKHEANKLNSFNFGSQQQPASSTSNFNFGTPKTETFATPHKPTAFGTPSASPASFVFGGQSNGIDTNFQQSLTPSATSSTTPRLIKKPTRRLKK